MSEDNILQVWQMVREREIITTSVKKHVMSKVRKSVETGFYKNKVTRYMVGMEFIDYNLCVTTCAKYA